MAIAFDEQRVPLLDVNRSNASLRDDFLRAISAVFDSGRFLHGPDVEQLEAAVAARCQTEHAVGCASGSDALLLSLMALGIGPGDEVIVPSFTFFATASCVWRLGAKIVFADIDPATYNLSPRHVAALINSRTKAVIAVHLFGQCAEMDELVELAQRHGLSTIEDAAQAIGAGYQGRAAGSWGQIGCFSFYPTKNLGGCGDGGMVTTNDSQLAEKLRLLAAHGMQPRYYHPVVGINSRLDTVQAAALRVKLPYLDQWTEERRVNAQRYRELFAEAGLDQLVRLPAQLSDADHVWNQFTIRIAGGLRDELRAHLTRHGVGTEIYYPHPLHLQDCFASLGYQPGSLPETEAAAREVLHVPIFPGLTFSEQRTVVGRIAQYYSSRQASAA